MPTRPLIETSPDREAAAPAPSQPQPTAGSATPESLLVSQLPAWDLVPADTLLVRRRLPKP
jgi:hypothetical protein